MTTICVKALIKQDSDSDERHASVEFRCGSSYLGSLDMPLEYWRALRSVLTVPDFPDEDAPDVALIIEEWPTTDLPEEEGE